MLLLLVLFSGKLPVLWDELLQEYLLEKALCRMKVDDFINILFDLDDWGHSSTSHIG